MVLGLRDEICRSEESRYDHRLHGVLLVAQGMTFPEVGQCQADALRTVEYWVHRFEKQYPFGKPIFRSSYPTPIEQIRTVPFNLRFRA